MIMQCIRQMKPINPLFTWTLLLLLPVFSLGQNMTYIDFSPWEGDSLIDTMDWVGVSETNPVTVCVREGNNHRNGLPDFRSAYNYSYQEVWFETWWDDAGVLSSTSLTPPALSVWSAGIDTIQFCFSKVVEGDSNFLYFHQVDFSNTLVSIEASLCGVPLNHNLIELNESSGSPSFVTTPTQATFSMSVGANRRHLVRFNQDFDFVRVIESNSADLLTLGFMGYGNFKGAACPSICPCESNPLLDLSSISLEAKLLTDEVLLSWEGGAAVRSYVLEKMDEQDQWQDLRTIAGGADSRFSFTDSKPIPGENVYRLRYFDEQGESHYSPAKHIHYAPQTDMKLFPNPLTGNQLYIHLSQEWDTDRKKAISFIDQQGRHLSLPYVMLDRFRLVVNTTGLTPGLYHVGLRLENGNYTWKRIIIQ